MLCSKGCNTKTIIISIPHKNTTLARYHQQHYNIIVASSLKKRQNNLSISRKQCNDVVEDNAALSSGCKDNVYSSHTYAPSSTPYTGNCIPEGIIRMWRSVPPAHYTFKIDSFSLFQSSNIDPYETCIFKSGGYKWKLSFYPNGNKKRNVKDRVSLYLSIANTDDLPSGWEVNVSFKLFLYNHISHKYLIYQAAEENTTRVYMLNTTVGFDELVPLATLKDPSNGFLLEDSCIFGAEVFPFKFNGCGECISMINSRNIFTWKIDNFPQITEEYIYSNEFHIEGQKWKLMLYPKGCREGKGKSISLFLELADNLPSDRKVSAKFILRVKGNHTSHDTKGEGEKWFSNSSLNWGFRNFISLIDFRNNSNLYLVNETLTVEAQITLISKHCQETREVLPTSKLDKQTIWHVLNEFMSEETNKFSNKSYGRYTTTMNM